jgi:hypothetical protein
MTLCLDYLPPFSAKSDVVAARDAHVVLGLELAQVLADGREGRGD